MDITVDLFDKICRACLSQSSDMKSLITKTEGNRKLVDMLCSFGNISINIEDMLPKQVCSECETFLNKAEAFQQRCVSSETYLNTVYENYLKSNSMHDFGKTLVAKDENDDNKTKIMLLANAEVLSCETEHPSIMKNDNLNQYTSSSSTDEKNLNTMFRSLENSGDTHSVKEELDNHSSEGFSVEFDNAVLDESDIAFSTTDSNDMEAVILCQCGLVLNDRQAYKFHLTITNCDKIRKPKIKWFKSESEQDMACPRCNKTFKNISQWTKHYSTNCGQATEQVSETENLNYQCSTCSRKYKSKKTLATHIKRLHKAPTTHKCQRCNREFKHKAFLDNHILSVHVNDQATCEFCGKQCLNQNDLDKHRVEHMEKKHLCTICKKAFSMLCTLKEHLRTHTGEKPFLCSFCGKGFSQKNNLQQHVMRHQGNKPFKCETCEKRFVSKGELDAHNRKHSGAHPFICDDCGNGFTTSSSLFKHRRIHTGERPYQCDLCPMRFTASGTLKNHRRTHTGERPYQCSHCEKAFVQRNDLVSHIRCHTGERPYSCDHCGQGFRKATGLKAHLKVHGKRDGEQMGLVPVPDMYRPELP